MKCPAYNEMSAFNLFSMKCLHMKCHNTLYKPYKRKQLYKTANRRNFFILSSIYQANPACHHPTMLILPANNKRSRIILSSAVEFYTASPVCHQSTMLILPVNNKRSRIILPSAVEFYTANPACHQPTRDLR